MLGLASSPLHTGEYPDVHPQHLSEEAFYTGVHFHSDVHPQLPVPPPDEFYPGVKFANYPPQLILEAYQDFEKNGKRVIHLKWTMTRNPTTKIRGFELYHHTNIDKLSPDSWERYLKVNAVNVISSMYFYSSKLEPNRMHYFTIRLDDSERMGPYSLPVGVYVLPETEQKSNSASINVKEM